MDALAVNPRAHQFGVAAPRSDNASMHRKERRTPLGRLMRLREIGDNELARKLKDRGTPVPQSTITRIATGKTKSADEATLKPIADFFGVTTGELRGQAAAAKVSERRPDAYAGLSPEAIELAKAWMKLPDFKRRGYLQAVMTDAATLEVFPELEKAMRIAAVAIDPAYHKLTEGFGRARTQLERQLKLALDS